MTPIESTPHLVCFFSGLLLLLYGLGETMRPSKSRYFGIAAIIGSILCFWLWNWCNNNIHVPPQDPGLDIIWTVIRW